MRKAPLLASALLAAIAVIAPVAQGAAASLSSPITPVPGDPSALLPVQAVSAIAVDAAHDHVFISSGLGSSSLLVTSTTGVVQKTIPLAAGSGMTLHWHYLYVAEAGADDIAVIDTWTLKVVGRISTGPNSCPMDVAFVGSRYLAYVFSCSPENGESLGVIDRNSKALMPRTAFTDLPDDSTIDAIPGSSHVLVSSSFDPTDNVIEADVSGTPRILHKTTSLGHGCTQVHAVTVSPDGRTFAAACSAENRVEVFKTLDLSYLDSYPAPAYPTAVAYSPSNKFFAVGGVQEGSSPNIDLYGNARNGHVQGLSASLDGLGELVEWNALTFSADSRWLFAVAGDYSGWHLHRISTARTHSAIQLTAASPVSAGAAASVSGTLTLGDGLVKDGLPVTVTKRVHGTTVPVTTTETTGGNNTISFVDHPTTPGWTTYLVTFAGDIFHGKAIGSVTVKVQ